MSENIVQWVNTVLISVVMFLIGTVGYFVRSTLQKIEKMQSDIAKISSIEKESSLLKEWVIRIEDDIKIHKDDNRHSVERLHDIIEKKVG